MINEFRPLKLSDAARHLDVDPFELVRLAVVFREATPDLRFPTASLARIKEQAGITSAWTGRQPPSDTNPVRAAVRGALAYLQDQGLVGQASTRLDNLGRGLGAVERDGIDEAASILAEEGVLLLLPSPKGLQVSVAPGAEGSVAAIVDGSNIPQALTALWAG